MNLGRTVGLACAVVLTAAACSQDEPIILSEAPQPSPTVTTDRDESGDEGDPDAGRFIARCATEADGDTVPGLTIFTDGTENVTDYCLRRFYVGVQPRPGLVYVPDTQTGYDAPTTQSPDPTTRQTWTPSEPRTDRTPTAEPPVADGPAQEGTATATTAAPSPDDAPVPTDAPTDTPDPQSPENPVLPETPSTPVEPTTPTEVPVDPNPEGQQPPQTTPTSPAGGQSPAPAAPAPAIPSQLPWFPVLFPPIATDFPTQIPVAPQG